MKNRLLNIVIFCLVACFAAMVFVACSDTVGNMQSGTPAQTQSDEKQDATTDDQKQDATTENGDEGDTATEAHTHTYGEWIAEEPANCVHTGVKGHYHCADCGKDFDAEHQELADLTIALTDHTYGEWIAEQTATCTEDGQKAHYHCADCDKDFDENKQEITDLAIPAAHTFGTWIEEVPAACTTTGVKGHYHCTACGKDFDEEYEELTDLVISALNHNFENGFCSRCRAQQLYRRVDADGTENAAGSYILFGSYPQSAVTDETITAALTAQAGTLPDEWNRRNWTSYGYYYSGLKQNLMWYIDLAYEGENYRGVYFIQYRPFFTTGAWSDDNSYQDDNGYYTRRVYWFKYEPLKWRILTESNGTAMILCESIIDSQQYYYNINSTRKTDWGANIYPNNYAESEIRTWLNYVFYQTAFTSLQQALIQTTTVNNSARSTNPQSNATEWDGGSNMYSCENTKDKVFLLSMQEVTNSDYGFGNYLTADAARRKQTTDYSRAMGLYVGRGGDSQWWLRSPTYDGEVRYASTYGYANGDVSNHYTSVGVVPAVWIRL